MAFALRLEITDRDDDFRGGVCSRRCQNHAGYDREEPEPSVPRSGGFETADQATAVWKPPLLEARQHLAGLPEVMIVVNHSDGAARFLSRTALSS